MCTGVLFTILIKVPICTHSYFEIIFYILHYGTCIVATIHYE